MQYQLSINIDPASLKIIYGASQAVTIVKSVVTSVTGDNLPVAWVHFQPMETNLVSWVENYYIYATTTAVQAGATIVQTSLTPVPVQPGYTYTLESGQFDTAQGGGAGSFNASNAQGMQLGFGLSQKALVNNVPTDAPLNAITVLNGEQASFTPYETVSIFLNTVIDNGVVLSQVASNALVVTLSSQQPSASISFDGASNTFILDAGAQLTPAQFAGRLHASASR